MLAAINLSVRGLPCGPPNKSSAVRMCRLVRIAAITPITRLRPSSIPGILRLSPCFRYWKSATLSQEWRSDMACYETHKYLGMAAGMGYSAFQAKEQTPLNLIAEMTGGTLGGRIGGTLPDKLEPAISSWHRSIAHSGTTAAAVTTTA